MCWSWQNPQLFIASYLLSGDAHVIPHIRENSGLNEEPFQAQSFASALQLGSFTDATLDKLQHTILLLPTDLWGRRRHITSDPRAVEIIKERSGEWKMHRAIKRETTFVLNSPADPAQ